MATDWASAGISAAADFASTIYQNRANAQASGKAMNFNAKQAAIDRDWQEKMSSTAYQRARADMEAAGINPILMATKGFSGASTPSGDSASATSPISHSGFSGIVKNAIDVATAKASLANLQATNKQILSQIQLNTANTAVASEQARKTHGDANVSEAEGSLAGLGFKYLMKGLGGFSSAIGSLKSFKSAKSLESPRLINVFKRR